MVYKIEMNRKKRKKNGFWVIGCFGYGFVIWWLSFLSVGIVQLRKFESALILCMLFIIETTGVTRYYSLGSGVCLCYAKIWLGRGSTGSHHHCPGNGSPSN